MGLKTPLLRTTFWRKIVKNDTGSIKMQKTLIPQVTEERLSGAERGRFERPTLPNALPKKDLWHKRSSPQSLRPFYTAPLIPAETHSANYGSGQKLAKFPEPSPLRFPAVVMPFVPLKAKRRAIIYTRYSTDMQGSTEDQTRACKEWAAREGVEVVDTLSDEGVSGNISERDGLERAKAKLASGQADTLIALSQSRLFRDSLELLEFIQQYATERGIRCVFLEDNVDTAANDNWRLVLGLKGVIDEAQLRMYSGHIREAHKGLADKLQVHGSLPFGYVGQPVEGRLTRRQRPRCAIMIDPKAAEYVFKIFSWFTDNEMGFQEIARRLKHEGAPNPPRAKCWSRLIVRLLLRNRRYVGDWSYGREGTVRSSTKRYKKKVFRESPLRKIHAESLRIVSDELFSKAAERARLLPNVGRTRKAPNGVALRHPLKGLLFCPTHNLALQSAGSDGRWLECSACKRMDEDKPLYSIANADIALKQIAKRILDELRREPERVEKIVARAHELVQSHRPAEQEQVDRLREKYEDAQFRVDAAFRNLKRCDDERLLRELTGERDALKRELEAAERSAKAATKLVSLDEVRAKFADLDSILEQAVRDPASRSDPEVNQRLHKCVKACCGDRIDVVQSGERKQHRGWLTAKLTLDFDRYSAGLDATTVATQACIDVDLCEPYASEVLADQVYELHRSGLRPPAIAKRIGRSSSFVYSTLHAAYRSRSEDMPKLTGPAAPKRAPREKRLFVDRSEDAWTLYEQKVPIMQIVRDLGVSWPTLQQALKVAATKRGVDVPDGRARRREVRLSKAALPLKATAAPATVTEPPEAAV